MNTAEELVAILGCAMSTARETQEPRHIIRQGGKFRIVKTFVEGDDVIATNITAPRKTHALMDAVSECKADLMAATQHAERISALLKKTMGEKAPRADEVVADLLHTACIWADSTRRAAGDHVAPPSMFARLFGRIAY